MRPLVISLLCLLFAATPAEEAAWTSASGVFVVSYSSELSPPQINKLHAWRLHIETASGEPVESAVIEVTGGMPEHDHGLPTRPRIEGELGDGDYRLEGVRFHMAGLWEIMLRISDGESTDTVVITLTL